METPEQLSVPTGAVKFTTAVHWPGEVLGFALAGQFKVGAWASTTVTEKLQVEVSPPASVAWKATLLTPNGKVEPLGKPLD